MRHFSEFLAVAPSPSQNRIAKGIPFAKNVSQWHDGVTGVSCQPRLKLSTAPSLSDPTRKLGSLQSDRRRFCQRACSVTSLCFRMPHRKVLPGNVRFQARDGLLTDCCSPETDCIDHSVANSWKSAVCGQVPEEWATFLQTWDETEHTALVTLLNCGTAISKRSLRYCPGLCSVMRPEYRRHFQFNEALRGF